MLDCLAVASCIPVRLSPALTENAGREVLFTGFIEHPDGIGKAAVHAVEGL